MDNKNNNLVTSSFCDEGYNILSHTLRSYFNSTEDTNQSKVPHEINEQQWDSADENGYKTNIDQVTRKMCDGVIYTFDTLLSKSATASYLASCIKTKDLNTLRIVVVCEQASEASQLTRELGYRSIGCLLLNEPTKLIESGICLWNNGLLSSVLVVCDYVLPHLSNIIRLGVNYVIHSTYPLPHVFQKRLELLIPKPSEGIHVLVIGSRSNQSTIWQSSPSQAIIPPTSSLENRSKVSLEKFEPYSYASIAEPKYLAQSVSCCIPSNSLDQCVPKIKDGMMNYNETEVIYTYNQFGIFAWSRCAQISCYNIRDVLGLDSQIKQGMQWMNICQLRARCVQRFGWPHAASGRSLFIVGNESTGKTLCYLPALCQNVLRNSRTRQICYAPSCIIVCASSKQCTQIGKLCRSILSSTDLNSMELITIYNCINLNAARILKRSCGLLITTAELLCHLLQSENSETPILKFTAIKCIAVDNIDSMWRASMSNCQKLKQWISEIHSRNNVQLFVVGRFWIDEFMRPLLQKSSDILVVFEDALEAAVFLRISVEFCTCPANFYDQNIRTLLQERKEKSIAVVCQNKSEALVLSILLKRDNVCNIIVDNVDTQTEQVYLKWKRESTKNRILLVTDDVIPKLRIGKIDCLFHYGYNSWPRFKTRFTLFYSNYEDQSLTNKGTSVIVVRPDDEKLMWFLCDFSLRHGIDPPDHYITLLAAHRLKNEQNHPRHTTPLCQQLILYGNCTRYDCQYRHFLRNCEPPRRRIEKREIKFYVLSCVTPAQTSVVLVENAICSFFYNLPLTKLTQNVQKYYENTSNHRRVQNPQIGDVCVVELNRLYQRVSVIGYDCLNYVRVKQVDAGTKIYVVYSSELLVCENEFTNAPFQAKDLRILGLTPFNMERIWSESNKKLVRQNFFKYQQGQSRSVYTATVEFTFHDIIFVNDVIDLEGKSLKSFVMANIPQYMSKNIENLLEANISMASSLSNEVYHEE